MENTKHRNIVVCSHIFVFLHFTSKSHEIFCFFHISLLAGAVHAGSGRWKMLSVTLLLPSAACAQRKAEAAADLQRAQLKRASPVFCRRL